MATDEVCKSTLTTGREWHLITCRKPDSSIKEGKHLILEGVGQPTFDELSAKEKQELQLLTFDLAEELASEPGRWRVDFNGPGVCTRPHWHAHIKLPAGQDELPRLVG